MLNFYRPFFMPCFGSHFENGKHLENFENAEISSGRHFQNGHHNNAQIQHCPISTTFHMWVDYDVPNRFPTKFGTS
jgi:hypothetical protein